MSAVHVCEDGLGNDHAAGIPGGTGAAGDADRKGFNRKGALFQLDVFKLIGNVSLVLVQDLIGGDPRFTFADLSL